MKMNNSSVSRKREENEYKKMEDYGGRLEKQGKKRDVRQGGGRNAPEDKSPGAPWTIVEGNDKRFARIKVLKTFFHQGFDP